ncbi:MAG TPA: aminotransferase class V-fold PLP-dependent enzyme [Casimicrobiaceae bacterium]|nr:aminotransferase class V-fold PLP-dependent enzyme [Casimicrobiaceae bacterium]
MTDIFDKLGLRRVINVSGTETPFGASPVRPEVIAAISEIIPQSVLMRELQSAASEVIARATGTEAGCVTGCTAAGIVIAVAACMTGRDLARVEQLPDTKGMKNEVVMQKGHEITYGHNVSQNVRIAGASVIEIGAATQCAVYQLRHAITPNTAAALYVVSPLTVQNRLIDLKTFCTVCHEYDVPVIVDAASVSDPRPYVEAGADLVLFSAHKAFASITAGVIAGRLPLVQACIYQEHGIGRPMKVGKEGVAGAMAALEAWGADDRDKARKALEARLQRVESHLKKIAGVVVSRQGTQIKLEIDRAKGSVSAYGLAKALFADDPAIIVWSQFAREGMLLLTFGKVTDGVADYVCQRIASICAAGGHAHESVPNIGDAVADQLQTWPVTLKRS